MTSPFRCKTCKKRTTITCPIQVQDETVYYEIKEYVTVPTGWEILTSVIGCASHSDFQNQREKVLDELVSWVNLGNLELEKHFPCDRLMIKLRELREGKDGELKC